MYTSEGVYVIPRLMPEELHNTHTHTHTHTHTRWMYAYAIHHLQPMFLTHLYLNHSHVAHPSHALYTPLWDLVISYFVNNQDPLVSSCEQLIKGRLHSTDKAVGCYNLYPFLFLLREGTATMCSHFLALVAVPWSTTSLPWCTWDIDPVMVPF